MKKRNYFSNRLKLGTYRTIGTIILFINKNSSYRVVILFQNLFQSIKTYHKTRITIFFCSILFQNIGISRTPPTPLKYGRGKLFQ